MRPAVSYCIAVFDRPSVTLLNLTGKAHSNMARWNSQFVALRSTAYHPYGTAGIG